MKKELANWEEKKLSGRREKSERLAFYWGKEESTEGQKK